MLGCVAMFESSAIVNPFYSRVEAAPAARAADLSLRIQPVHDLNQALGYGPVAARNAASVRCRDGVGDRIAQARQRLYERGIVP
jgi:hypothetical protein